MKNDNRGYSLVEIIMVIAILAIIATGAIVGIKLITGKPAEKCARQIQTVLTSCRTTTMGKLTARTQLYVDASTGNIMVNEVVDSSVKTYAIGQSGVEVTYQLQGESTERALPTSPELLSISFDRSSGGVQSLDASNPLSVQGMVLQYIYVRKGDKAFKLTVSSLTGRVDIEAIP